jgi:hypothetical protein
MKMAKRLLVLCLICVSMAIGLTACGGGGGGDNNQPPTTPPTNPARHHVTIFPGQKAEVTLAMDGDNITDLVLNGDGVLKINKGTAAVVYFNYQCGWHVSGGNALQQAYGPTPIVISGVPASAQFLVSITDTSGKEYTLNPDFTDVTLSDGTKLEFDKTAGVYKYGDQSAAALACH